MLNLIRPHLIRPHPVPPHQVRARLATTIEHASWMVVVAAETLAVGQADQAGRDWYAEAGRRMSNAARRWWFDARAMRAASPSAADPDGARCPMVDLVAGYGRDPESGIRAAMALLLAARGSEGAADGPAG